MLSALITGTLATDPKAGTSKSGTEWANAVVRVPCGKDRETGDQESAFVQVAAFGDEAGKLARLTKGDSVSASGALKPSEYQAKDGSTRHGLSLTATGILTAYQIQKKRGDQKPHGKEADREQIQAYDKFARGVNQPRPAADFDDELTF
jgi:single-stranded DNA-binding protein